VATRPLNVELETALRTALPKPSVVNMADQASRCALSVYAALNSGMYSPQQILSFSQATPDTRISFCGSIPDFCDKGCQKGFGGCGDVTRPSCSRDGGSVETRNIGYYESWANTRKCSAVSPEDLNLNGFTHLNFAFVFFDPNTLDIVPMDKNAGELLQRFTALKEKKPGLQTWVSVGGWSFNDRKSRLSVSFIYELLTLVTR
jgi:hypothetical protein